MVGMALLYLFYTLNIGRFMQSIGYILYEVKLSTSICFEGGSLSLLLCHLPRKDIFL